MYYAKFDLKLNFCTQVSHLEKATHETTRASNFAQHTEETGKKVGRILSIRIKSNK